MSSEFDLDFSNYEHETLPIKIKNKNGGVDSFTLVQATGAVARDFENAQTDAAIFNDQGKVIGFRDSARVVPILLCGCVLDSKGNPVTEKTVSGWPAEIQDRVFKAAKKLSKLEKEDEPLAQAVLKAFSRPDAPASLSKIRQWTKGLKGNEFKQVVNLFSETDEEVLGKQKAETATGSS